MAQSRSHRFRQGECAEPARSAPSPGGQAAAVLRWQGSAGNQAVSRLIQQRAGRTVSVQAMALRAKVDRSKPNDFVEVNTEEETDRVKLVAHLRDLYRGLDIVSLKDLLGRMEKGKADWNAFDQDLVHRISRRLKKVETLHAPGIKALGIAGKTSATKGGTVDEPGNWANAQIYLVYPKPGAAPNEPQSKYEEVVTTAAFVSGVPTGDQNKYRHPGKHVEPGTPFVDPKEEELSENDSEASLFAELEDKLVAAVKKDNPPKRIVVNVYSKMGACDGCKQRTALFEQTAHKLTGVPVRLRYIYPNFSKVPSRAKQFPTIYGWADAAKNPTDPRPRSVGAFVHNEHYPPKA